MLDGGTLRDMLDYKCERDSGILIKVEPHFTSQECSSCGERIKKSIFIRTHISTALIIGSLSQRQPERIAKKDWNNYL